MHASHPATRTLQRAAGIVGETGLAYLLGVSAQDLGAWLSGERVPPATIYFIALDIVAGRPLAVRTACAKGTRRQ